MMLLFLISAAITVFLLAAMLILMLSGKETADARLMEIAASQPVSAPTLAEMPKSGLARVAVWLTRPLQTIRDLLSRCGCGFGDRLPLAGVLQGVAIWGLTRRWRGLVKK